MSDFRHEFDAIKHELGEVTRQRRGLTSVNENEVGQLQNIEDLVNALQTEEHCAQHLRELAGLRNFRSTDLEDEPLLLEVHRKLDAEIQRYQQMVHPEEPDPLNTAQFKEHPVIHLKRFVEHRDQLSDAQWEDEVRQLSEEFPKRLVTAAVRGRLVWSGSASSKVTRQS